MLGGALHCAMHLGRHQRARVEGRHPAAVDDGSNAQFGVDVVHGFCRRDSLRRGQAGAAGILQKTAPIGAERSSCHEILLRHGDYTPFRRAGFDPAGPIFNSSKQVLLEIGRQDGILPDIPVESLRGVRMKKSSRRRILGIGIGLSSRLLAADSDARQLGVPLGPYGERSPFEKAVQWRRDTKTPETGSSFTPLADSVGTLTPSSLHYERHHAGIPPIDPAQHRLVIHGMVERPTSFTVAEIRRLPSVSRTLVLECGGNSGSEWGAKTAPDVQRSHGLVSCSEWTGVPLSLLLL